MGSVLFALAAAGVACSTPHQRAMREPEPALSTRWRRMKMESLVESSAQRGRKARGKGGPRNGTNAKESEDESEDEFEAALLTRNFGVVGVLWGLSFVVGPLTSGLLIGATGSARAVCLLVAASDTAAWAILRVQEQQKHVYSMDNKRREKRRVEKEKRSGGRKKKKNWKHL